jgi:hypothetical protein
MYHGTAQAGTDPVLSTGETDKILRVEAGDTEKSVRVTLHPDGKFEIDIVDFFGDPVGHVIAPKGGKRGVRVLKGKL